jgi:hypothetical protein
LLSNFFISQNARDAFPRFSARFFALFVQEAIEFRNRYQQMAECSVGLDYAAIDESPHGNIRNAADVFARILEFEGAR